MNKQYIAEKNNFPQVDISLAIYALKTIPMSVLLKTGDP